MKTINFSRIDKAKFFRTLNKRVNTYFKENNIKRTGNWKLYSKAVIMFSLFLVPFILILTVSMPQWLMIVFMVITGIGMAGVGMNVMHDSNHESFSSRKWVNKLMGSSIYILAGNVYNWKVQHNVLHHTYTNVKDYDEDIDAGRIIRFSKHSKWFQIHRLQKYYSIFLYGLLTINWAITTDFKQMRSYLKRKLSYGKFPNPKVEWTKLVISKVLYYSLWVVLPLLVLDIAWWKVLLGFFVMHYTAGMILSLIFQLAHVVPNTEMPTPDKDGNLEHTWAVHQLYTTSNFAPSNWLVNFYTGGLNHQVEHHIFPHISHVHYKKLAKIVKETTKEFNLPYNEYQTTRRAIIEHFRQLGVLGKKPQMAHPLSDRINSLPISQTLAMAAKARELKTSGKDIISLSLGEPDFNTPDFIKDAAIEAINQNYNSYTPVDGYLELKEAICVKFKRDNGLTYEPNQVVVSTGAKQSIANVAQVLLNPGDEVLLPAPYWVSYSAIATLCEAKFVEIPSSIDTDFKITPEQLEEVITPKTKMIFFNSPNNPSGTIYSENEYRALAQVLEKHPQIYILSDEIYEHINYGAKPFSFANIESMYDRTITVNGLAKAFAMTGWRIGYIGAPQWIAKACNKMQGQITSGANCIAQRAAITAVLAPINKIQYMVDEFKSRRDMVLQLLGEIDGFKLNVPEGAFYIFPDISSFFGRTFNGTTINNANDFSLYLLEEANVATVTGEAFGAPNCIRLSYAASVENLQEAIRRIKKAVQ